MKKYNITVLLICVGLFTLTFSGIIRDDVSEDAYLNLAKQKQFDCVGQVYSDSTARGSCVLISEKYLLTAAHVLIESEIIIDTIIKNGNTYYVNNNNNMRICNPSKIQVRFNGKKAQIKNITVHPTYLASITKGNCDLAIMELETSITDIAPAKINQLFDELNADVVGAGFGVSGKASKPDSVVPANKKIAGENTINRISGYKYNGQKTLLMCDFDHTTLKNCNKMGSAVPKSLEYICGGGDSGGGLFKLANNEWQLVGICAGGGIDFKQFLATGYYGQIMEWTRVSAFANWIQANNKQ